MRDFISSSNESVIKCFNILEPHSLFTIKNAHSDNIKKVQYVDDNLIMSASQDKVVKLWDLRNYSQPLSHVTFANSIEDFVAFRPNQYAIANGSILSTIKINESQKLIKQNEFIAFQKPIMKVKYDKVKDRILAGGLDSSLKFFQIEENPINKELLDLKVAYKIKVPSEVFCLDISQDGHHIGMGLNNGSLIIKSKLIEEVVEIDEEEKLLNTL